LRVGAVPLIPQPHDMQGARGDSFQFAKWALTAKESGFLDGSSKATVADSQLDPQPASEWRWCPADNRRRLAFWRLGLFA